MRKSLAVTFAVLGLSSVALATGPGAFSYEGRMYQSDGVTPVTGNMTFQMQILSPSGCVLRVEETVLNLGLSAGVFDLKVGVASQLHASDPGLSLSQIYQNSPIAVTGVSSCSYTPVAGDVRKLRIIANGTVLSPDIEINSVPFAVNADNLGGRPSNQFLNVNTSGGKQVTQANLENILADSSRVAELSALSQGNSSKYVKYEANKGSSIPAYAGSPAAPVAGSVWFDSVSGKMKYHDGTTAHEFAAGGGGVGSNSVGSSQIIDGSIAAADLAGNISISTTGSVTANSISASGALSANSMATRGIMLFDPDMGSTNKVALAAHWSQTVDYNLTFPPTGPGMNQFLVSDNIGNLGWQNVPAAAAAGSNKQLQFNNSGAFGASANLTYDAANTYFGIGTAVPAQMLHLHDANNQNYIEMMMTNGANGSDGFTVGVARFANNLASGVPANSAFFWNQGNYPIVFGTNNLPNMIVTGAGAVGIGTVTPTARLDVAGSIRVGTSGQPISQMGVCTINSFNIQAGRNQPTCSGVKAGAAVSCSPGTYQGPTVTWSAMSPADNSLELTSSAMGSTTAWKCHWAL